jgi:transcriptional regulator with XRE-family HTH domain
MFSQIPLEDDTDLEQQLKMLGTRLQLARSKANLSIDELAKATRVSPLTLSRMEAGNGGVGSRNLMAVLSYHGMSLDDFSRVVDQEDLPLHAICLEDEKVSEVIEEAARAAIEKLDELFPGNRPEVDGISSNAQGLLVEQIKALLKGQSHYTPSYLTYLKPLVYSDSILGREYSKKQGAGGYLVRLVGTDRVLEDGRFRLARKATDMYSSWEAAAAAVRKFVNEEGHLPGPVRIVSGWWTGEDRGVRFTPLNESVAEGN